MKRVACLSITALVIGACSSAPTMDDGAVLAASYCGNGRPSNDLLEMVAEAAVDRGADRFQLLALPAETPMHVEKAVPVCSGVRVRFISFGDRAADESFDTWTYAEMAQEHRRVERARGWF